MKKTLLIALLIALPLLSIFVINLVYFRPFSIDMFYEKVFVEFLLASPQSMTSLGLPGSRFVNDELDDHTRDSEDASHERAKESLAALLKYDVGSMSAEQARSRKILI